MIIQYLLIATLVAAMALTWRRVRQGALGRGQAALWSLLWVTAGVVVMRPEFSSLLADFLGVGRGVDAVIYVAIVGLYYLVFRIFLRLDRFERQLTVLVRQLSLQESSESPTDNEASAPPEQQS